MSKKVIGLIGCLGSLAVIGLCVIIALAFGLVSDDTEANRVAGMPVPDAAPLSPAPPYEEIKAEHDKLNDTTTEVQWQAYRDGIIGTQAFQWGGWVDQVEKDMWGNYWVHIDMDPPDATLSVAEVRWQIPEDTALSLGMDQEIVFSGRIATAQDVMTMLDIVLEDVTWE